MFFSVFTTSLLLFHHIANAQFPALEWVKKMGGAGFDNPNSATIDEAGNIYTVGSFEGTVDLDPGTGIFNLTSIGKADIYISKLDAMGNFVWAKQIGRKSAGKVDVIANSIVADKKRGLYITGSFNGTVDFDPSSKVYNLSDGNSDAFILKLDTAGNFNWARNVGGRDDDKGTDIAVDLLGNVYTCGRFVDTADFDPGLGSFKLFADFDTTLARTNDVFILKLDSNGNFVWAKQIGGLSVENADAMQIDSLGNIYITGDFFKTVDFDPSPTTSFFLTSTDPFDSDVFIAKYDSSGKLIWVKQIGSAGGTELAKSISIDLAGNVYTTGSFTSTVDFDPSSTTFNMTSIGQEDIYICKLDNSGKFVWAKQMGSVSGDRGASITVDKTGNIYTTGTFTETCDFDPSSAIFNLTAKGLSDVFISKLEPSGNFVWARSIGGNNNENSTTIKADKNGNLFTVGQFFGTADFDPSLGIFNLSSDGWSDIFVYKMSQTATKISENNLAQELHIYPNPSNGIFKLFAPNEIDKASMEILDVQGRIFYRNTIHNGDNLIDLSGVADGVYFVKISTAEGKQQFTKIIKQAVR